jgi:hypothetical protein
MPTTSWKRWQMVRCELHLVIYHCSHLSWQTTLDKDSIIFCCPIQLSAPSDHLQLQLPKLVNQPSIQILSSSSLAYSTQFPRSLINLLHFSTLLAPREIVCYQGSPILVILSECLLDQHIQTTSRHISRNVASSSQVPTFRE